MEGGNWLSLRMSYIILSVMTLAFIAVALGNADSGTDDGLAFNMVINQALAGNVCKLSEAADGTSIAYYTKCTEGSLPAGRVSKSPRIAVAEYLQQEQALRLQRAALAGGQPPDLKLPVITREQPALWSGVPGILSALLPPLLLIGAFVYLTRQGQGSQNQALDLGKSRARRFTTDTPVVALADVAGQEEAKQDLAEVVEFLKSPAKFARLGARIPRGVLMVGPPGAGKTLLSRAVAGEAGVPFFSISGSEFVEMFVGVGAARVRDLFAQAKRNAPCIVFIDEIDSVGRRRGNGITGAHDEREQTLNQILVEMDGFDNSTTVIVIAATNRPDVLDPALVRPGRFDRQVILDAPDVRGRLEILRVHAKGKPLAEDVRLEAVAKVTPGASGADLANIVNEAAILAARWNKQRISMRELEQATERMLLGGPERRSRVMTAEEQRLTAYHEAGHAIVGAGMPKSRPVHKVTIVPRGRAGGYTLFLPEDDRTYRTVEQFEAELAAAMGGRAAEELALGDFTTGASGDIVESTRLARAMVTHYGMSGKLGPVLLGEQSETSMVAFESAEQRNYSEATARLIDAEVKRLVDTGHERARSILQANLDVLHDLAGRLMQVETLSGGDLDKILNKVRRFDSRGNGYSRLPLSPVTLAAD
jgi:cell division protease FtsH